MRLCVSGCSCACVRVRALQLAFEDKMLDLSKVKHFIVDECDK
jgi:hypothetical protein